MLFLEQRSGVKKLKKKLKGWFVPTDVTKKVMAWWLWKTNSQWKHSKAGRCMANSGKTEAEEKLYDKRLAQITSRKVLNRKPEILLSRYFASLWPRGKNEDYNLWLFYFKQLKNCYWACQYTPMQCKNSISALHASCQKKLFVI